MLSRIAQPLLPALSEVKGLRGLFTDR